MAEQGLLLYMNLKRTPSPSLRGTIPRAAILVCFFFPSFKATSERREEAWNPQALSVPLLACFA